MWGKCSYLRATQHHERDSCTARRTAAGNVEFHLQLSDVPERDGYGSTLGNGQLVVTIECGGSGYLKIGPALDALEEELIRRWNSSPPPDDSNWFEHTDALWRRVPTNVVDCHRPRVGQTGDRSTQGTADSLIQVDENRLIEWPYVPCGKAVGGSCEEWLGWVIHKELDLVCRPNDPVGVESCVHCLSAGEKEAVRKSVPAGKERVDSGTLPCVPGSVEYLR